MIEFPPFHLDTVNECLWRRREGLADERILLPPKTFRVLRHLVTHAGRLVTEDELLTALWPKAYVQPEAVKMQIYTLRNALGDDARAPRYIETLPRRGYRFIATIHDPPSTHATATTTQTHRPFVGRDWALAELRASLLTASRGQRQIVFVTGEPGIGKTALADEFQRETARDFPSIRIGRGQCIEGYGGTEAYFPMLEALGQLSVGSAAAFIVETLATQAPTWLVQFPALLTRERREVLQREIQGATRERMLREICVALEAIVLQFPLLLILEDMHWADHATVDLISVLARRRVTAKLLLLVTTRPVKRLPPGHPLKALSQELLAHRLCNEVVLQPLTESDVAAYLATDSTTEPVTGGLADLIHGHTQGNPLFMVSALDYLAQRGLIWRENGAWRLRVPLQEIHLGVPETLRQMIEAQIERLSTEEQRALEAASVLGVAFEVRAGAAAAAIELDDFEDICDRMARRQDILREKIRESTNAPYEYRFAHPLYREVFYHRQIPARRARIHLRCGDWLESHSTNIAGDLAPTLAHHFEEAGSWERAVKHLQISAEIATSRLAHREAASILRHALGLVDKLPPSRNYGMEIDVLRSLCSILEINLDDGAIEFYDILANKSEQYGLIAEHVRTLNDMAGVVARVDNRRCIQLLDRAIELAPQITDPVLRIRELAASHINKTVLQGWTAQDAANCREWIERARPHLTSRELAPLLLQFSWILVHLSRYRDALQAAEEALATFDANLRGQRNTLGYFAKQYALEFLGEWGRALNWSEEISAILAKNGYSVRASSIMLIRPRMYVHADNGAAALPVLESMLELFLESKLIPLIRYCQAWIALASAGLGNVDRAVELLVTLEEDLSRIVLPADLTFRPILEWGFVEAFLSAGDIAKADLHHARWVAAAERIGEVTWQGLAWEAGVRIALANGDVSGAQLRLASASAAIKGYEAPLASWKILASAADVEDHLGNHAAADNYRRLSAATTRALANSMPETEATRDAFLASARVRHVLDAL